MHGCWSPVPKCRPSFQVLVLQLEALVGSLSPAPPPREPLHYVNLEDEQVEACSRAPPSEEEAMLGAATLSWMIPWQQEMGGGAADWLTVGSGAALAIGGDYRYILGPCGLPGEEEEEQRGRALMMREESLNNEVKDEDDDAIIHV